VLRRERIEDRWAGIVLPALFQPDVVVDADPAQRGELLAPQTGCAAQPGAGRQADVDGFEPAAPGPQEIAQATDR
jgi:hypothetical protein